MPRISRSCRDFTRDIAEQHDDLLCTTYAEFPTNQGTTAFEHEHGRRGR